uniref:Damage-control phosphatase ARMT1-like metal-binding domain-containing protein n=1 Tax=Candidatus Kentrum sp. FM TaxID=2126340 RepID=A0A450W142_9GAMM|nr:MAG: hypothetical protein BECKFM1743A_GA0114220_101374 [Candidatus Kentron sp. FM]VFJ55659.1 MAG: hypothetical protein BECKFM1743C_GA0114222_101623 [Candidatus Kentron sp. FM]VFK10774.1 MAG: hypothetical protein BECKFM1743B_GA0114221_101543 [Candidatus Kentron sp. FM]
MGAPPAGLPLLKIRLKTMQTDMECYPCLLRLAVDMGKIATADEGIRWKILHEVLRRISVFQKDRVPIVMGREIQSIVRRLGGNPDPYREIKREYNRKARDMIPFVDAKIAGSDDRLLTALKMITIANIIDFGAFGLNQLGDLVEFFRTKSSSDFKGAVRFEQFAQSLRKANSILYVADNCGEIILDCHFIDSFLADKRVYLSVRGAPVLNDATREDLEGIPLQENVTIMDTGEDSPGAILETRSLSDLGIRSEGKRDRGNIFEDLRTHSELFDEKTRKYGPISAFPQ